MNTLQIIHINPATDRVSIATGMIACFPSLLASLFLLAECSLQRRHA